MTEACPCYWLTHRDVVVFFKFRVPFQSKNAIHNGPVVKQSTQPTSFRLWEHSSDLCRGTSKMAPFSNSYWTRRREKTNHLEHKIESIYWLVVVGITHTGLKSCLKIVVLVATGLLKNIH